MTKATKKFTLIVLAVLCIVACVSVLVACNDDPKPTGVDYTVTVLNPDNTAASGVSVTVKKSGATIGTAVQTNADGKVTFTLAEDDGYTVALSTLPAHCEVAENTNVALSKDGLTIKLAEEFHYTVTLSAEATETPFVAENLFVVICTITEQGGTGVCLPAVAVGNDGVAKIYPDKNLDIANTTFKIKVEGLDEDYYYDDKDEDGYLDGAIISESIPSHTVAIFKKEQEPTVNVIEVKENLSKFADQEGTLVGVALNGTAKLVYNDTDKCYHLGEANGPVVVVNLTGENDPNRIEAPNGLIYLEMSTLGGVSYDKLDVTPAGSSDEKVYADYRTFLRGFEDYKYVGQQNVMTIPSPEEITTEVYYAKFVNSDGVYPLTKELETFLKLFCANQKDFLDFNGPFEEVAEGCMWLFPCYYYDENASVVPVDPIVKNYNLVSITDGNNTMAVGEEYVGENYIIQNVFQTLADGNEDVESIITADIAVLIIEANGSFSILLADGEPYDNGTWSNNDGTYTFNTAYGTVITYSNGTFTMVDDAFSTTMVFAANA
ncbi:MAG: Ig-like domain-containing protein [Clostridia bacterium]|nr:Ig-like domain-containing protein [Clostridia bacterium]